MSRRESLASQRQLRVGEELRHALAHVLERGDVRDPALANTTITVTEVRISPDLRQATAFVMPLGGNREREVVAALGRARGFLRRQIAKGLRLKFVPDLTFRLDRSFDEADRIARVLREPSVARDLRTKRSHLAGAQEAEPGDEDGRG